VALADNDVAVGFAMPSPDGRSLYFVRRVGSDNIIMMRDIDGGPEREVARGSGNTPPPALSMDGTHLAIGRTDERSKSSQVLVVPLQGGEPRVVHTEAAPDFIRFISWLPGARQLLLVRSRDGGTGQKGVLASVDGTPARGVLENFLPATANSARK
jgi:Tol biopolymer transport system component